MSDDRLVVGRQRFVKDVAIRLHATDEHSCEQQTRPDYKAMARDLWALGYRFDPEARRQWLIVELRSKMPAELQEMFAELLRLGLGPVEAEDS